MGMFDSVYFWCPKCGTRLEEQSKAGECRLWDYSANGVPEVIAQDIEGHPVFCGTCLKTFTIKRLVPRPPSAKMYLADEETP